MRKHTSLYLNLLLAVALVAMSIKLVSKSGNKNGNVAADLVPTPKEMKESDETVVPSEDCELVRSEGYTDIVQPKTEVTDKPINQLQSVQLPVEEDGGDAEKTSFPISSATTPEMSSATINTTDVAADVRGYNGPTPVEITVRMGRVEKIVALPNNETPRFFEAVVASGLLNSWNGLLVDEAMKKEVDGVTGATFSSKSVIENVRRGLDWYTQQ